MYAIHFSALSELKDAGLLNIPAYCSGNTGKSATLENAIDLDEGIRKSSGTHPVVKDVVGFQDKLVYIYTSGTTGLPKAAPIKHARYFYMVVGGHFMQDLKENDIQYTALVRNEFCFLFQRFLQLFFVYSPFTILQGGF